MARDLDRLIAQMTLEEKAGLCSGEDMWRTKGVARLGIPSMMVTDGPHGLRKQDTSGDHVGIGQSVPATCFPAACALACSWDRDLLYRMGVALGEECQAEGVAVLLGPGANIKRSPLCGRNFEYFSEDPYLSAEMAASHIQGVQSQGVGTSLKHFAANNQETRRMTVDVCIDERSLREIYLASFEGAVKKAQPWTVMCSYNKVNGTYGSEHPYLLTDILKGEWQHRGFVVSDWGAVNERVDGLRAGLELEMPSSHGINDRKIVEAVTRGELPEAVLDAAVKRLLTVLLRAVDERRPEATYDREDHHQLARQVARECMVLLKNDDGILPLGQEESIAVIGALARSPRYQGGGSSHVHPTKQDDLLVEMRRVLGEAGQLTFCEGYDVQSDDSDAALLEEAVAAAAQAQVAVLFIGLPERYESEGYDRDHLAIPENQRQLVEAVADAQPRTVVVLSNGAPIAMPWLPRVQGVLEAYLGGQALGGALSDVLFGLANPCGKLAETFPRKLSDNPSYLNFPGEGDRVEYREGLFVGYRYYDKKELAPLFPFGFGLSYTEFAYSDLHVDHKELTDQDIVTVAVTVRNVGACRGKEVVQLYVEDVESTVIRPPKELKGFAKVDLQPGEAERVTFTLDARAFAYYNTDIGDWHVERGDFAILIGRSSQDIVLWDTVLVQSTVPLPRTFTRNSTLADLMSDPRGLPIAQEMMAKLASAFNVSPEQQESVQGQMMQAVMRQMPLRTFVSFSQGAFTEEMLAGLLHQINQG